jgi:hypothetical protein
LSARRRFAPTTTAPRTLRPSTPRSVEPHTRRLWSTPVRHFFQIPVFAQRPPLRHAQVIVASTDSHFSHHAWANTDRKEGGLKPMKIPMLSDIDHKISEAYGVLHDDGFCLRYDVFCVLGAQIVQLAPSLCAYFICSLQWYLHHRRQGCPSPHDHQRPAGYARIGTACPGTFLL